MAEGKGEPGQKDYDAKMTNGKSKVPLSEVVIEALHQVTKEVVDP